MDDNGPKFRPEIQQVSIVPLYSIHVSHQTSLKQMMYIAGETQDPSVETISLVEEITRDQVVLMVSCSLSSRFYG